MAKSRTATTKNETEKPTASDKPTGTVVETRSPKVFAAVCPVNAEHTNTRVTSTQGKVRYCICDDCGHHWKQIGPETDQVDTAGPLREFALSLADQLDGAERLPPSEDDESGEHVIVIGDADAKATAEQLRLLAGV